MGGTNNTFMWLVHNEQIWKIFFPSLQTLPTQQELLVLGYCHSSHRKDFKHIPMHIFIYLPPLFYTYHWIHSSAPGSFLLTIVPYQNIGSFLLFCLCLCSFSSSNQLKGSQVASKYMLPLQCCSECYCTYIISYIYEHYL